MEALILAQQQAVRGCCGVVSDTNGAERKWEMAVQVALIPGVCKYGRQSKVLEGLVGLTVVLHKSITEECASAHHAAGVCMTCMLCTGNARDRD
jgi:hypothetical protein